MAVNKVIYGGETLVDLTGDSVTPETLAEGATAHDASGQKITGRMVPGGGASVQSDWNQTDETAADFIKNKPFGVFAGDTLTWEFAADQLTEDNLVGGLLLKASDAVVTMADFSNGCAFHSALIGETIHFGPDEIMALGEGVTALPDALALFVTENAVGAELPDLGIVFPESGVYVLYELLEGTISIPGYEGFHAIKKMPEKYLPDSCVTQTLFYINDYENNPRIYKDVSLTEMLTSMELHGLGLKAIRVVLMGIRATYDAVSMDGGNHRILYAFNNDGTYELRAAYTADYTD